MVLELQRVLAAHRATTVKTGDVPVFDDRDFRRGAYVDGALLRFRGIVRDVLDPELVVLTEESNADELDLAAVDPAAGRFVERVPLKVALVPHLTSWAAARYHAPTPVSAPPSHSSLSQLQQRLKRPNEDVNETIAECNEVSVDPAEGDPAAKKSKAMMSHKRVAEKGTDDGAFGEQLITIYVYDGQYRDLKADSFKVNESFEFIGVLDMLVLSASGGKTMGDDARQSLEELTIADCLEAVQCKQQSSVVLHCCDAMRLGGIHAIHPHESTEFYSTLANNSARMCYLEQRWAALGGNVRLVSIRNALVEHLSNVLCGDRLAAEYVLLCLLSRVYSRPDNATTLGNLSINLSVDKNIHASTTKQAIDRLRVNLETIVPMCASVDLSIQSLNESMFAPAKDYEKDTLRCGKLQFAHGTTVLVDETLLSAGQLKDQGVRNLGALQSLVGKLLLPYDFQYYSMDFPQDAAVLSISQGKSILPVHVSVPVHLNEQMDTVNLEESIVESFRLYLAVLRLMDVRLGNEQADLAEKHYVDCRKAKQEVSVEDLHCWLRLARLMALSHGEDEVTKSNWDAMLALEAQRIERMDARVAK